MANELLMRLVRQGLNVNEDADWHLVRTPTDHELGDQSTFTGRSIGNH